MSNISEISELAQITYYCHERHKYFKRNVVIDKGQSCKLLNVTFATLLSVANNETSVVIIVSNGFRVANYGMSASVPAMLFGAEYYRARRRNLKQIWDWRKANFAPITSVGVDLLMEKLYG